MNENRKCTVFFPDEMIEVVVDSGTLIKDVLKDQGISIKYPCGGKGSCHKCKVLVSSKETGGEKKSLACVETIKEDCHIQVVRKNKSNKKSESSPSVADKKNEVQEPWLKKVCINFNKKTSESWLETVEKTLEDNGLDVPISLDLVRKAVLSAESNQGEVSLLASEYHLLEVEIGNHVNETYYGLAVEFSLHSTFAALMDFSTGDSTPWMKIDKKASEKHRIDAEILESILIQVAELNSIDVDKIKVFVLAGEDQMLQNLLNIPDGLGMLPEFLGHEIGMKPNYNILGKVVSKGQGKITSSLIAALEGIHFQKNKKLHLLINEGDQIQLVLGCKKKGFIFTEVEKNPEKIIEGINTLLTSLEGEKIGISALEGIYLSLKGEPIESIEEVLWVPSSLPIKKLHLLGYGTGKGLLNLLYKDPWDEVEKIVKKLKEENIE